MTPAIALATAQGAAVSSPPITVIWRLGSRHYYSAGAYDKWDETISSLR